MTFEDLNDRFNSLTIIDFLTCLQLLPANQGKEDAMEQLCSLALRQFNPDDGRQRPRWTDLKAVAENHDDAIADEDDLPGCFTETAVFEEGNYVVYPGHFYQSTNLLNNLTECIFLHRHTLSKPFVALVRNAVGLLLHMSNSIAVDLEHQPYIYNRSLMDGFEVPDYSEYDKLLKSFYLPDAYLTDVCTKHKYDFQILDHFLYKSGNEIADETESDRLTVNLKPFVRLGKGTLIYMPTGIVNSLVQFIFDQANATGNEAELKKLLYERQFHLGRKALEQLGWMGTNIKLPTDKNQVNVLEAVYQFDNQKLGYICFVKIGQEAPIGVTVEERATEVVTWLNALNQEQPYHVLCLFVLAETEVDAMFIWHGQENGNLSLTLNYNDLITLAYHENSDKLTLWKFAKCYDRTNALYKIICFGSTLDAYALFLANDGSLLDPNAANPYGDTLPIPLSISDRLTRTELIRRNEHAVLLFQNRQFAYPKVIRLREYAPIYKEDDFIKYFFIVLECYPMPIWISSKQTDSQGRSWATHACDAIAFWLNKMEPRIGNILKDTGFVQFHIDLVVDDQLTNGADYIVQNIDFEGVSLPITFDAPEIHITIPFDFVYFVRQPDNRADRLLMKTILIAFREYVTEAKRTIALDDIAINSIIEEIMVPSQAKMILFADPTVNLRMDNRHLPPHRFIQATDTSYILDNLVSYFPQDYHIPAAIESRDDKIELCNQIVFGLWQKLATLIEPFNGEALLKWLIAIQERNIQYAEFREILIPAKIACFGDFAAEVNELNDQDKDLDAVSNCCRTLIEFVAAKLPTGNRWANEDDIDELLAFTDQIMEWGNFNEAIRHRFTDPKMGLLPSGRIGANKSLQHLALMPYREARTESEIFKNTENFDSNYLLDRASAQQIEDLPEFAPLRVAYRSEFNVDLLHVVEIASHLMSYGYEKASPCTFIEKKELYAELKKALPHAEDLDAIIDHLTLKVRPEIWIAQDGYSDLDIFPWRFNRSLSYLRRPLIKFTQQDREIYAFGYRHLSVYIEHMFYLFYTSKFPANSKPLKKWLGGLGGKKGSPFRIAVKSWLENNTDWEIVQYEVDIKKNAGANHLDADRDYGDIDIMAIDHKNKVIYMLECKNILGAKNIHQMKTEMDEYLGRDANDEKARIRMHATRDSWLKEHQADLEKYVPSVMEYTIRSIVMTNDQIPLPFLKEKEIPLPVKAFVFLRRHGSDYLTKDFPG